MQLGQRRRQAFGDCRLETVFTDPAGKDGKVPWVRLNDQDALRSVELLGGLHGADLSGLELDVPIEIVAPALVQIVGREAAAVIL